MNDLERYTVDYFCRFLSETYSVLNRPRVASATSVGQVLCLYFEIYSVEQTGLERERPAISDSCMCGCKVQHIFMGEHMGWLVF